MLNPGTGDDHFRLDDGFGRRRVEAHPRLGTIEILDVAPAIARNIAAEQALRARAAKYAAVASGAMTPVHHVTSAKDGVHVASAHQPGVRLSDVLADLEFGNVTLSDAALMEMAAAVARAVAAVHQLPGGMVHGALNPAHVVLTTNGTAVLTDSVFGSALEALQWNREQVWREFGLAMPAAASLHRFDQRADVAQLGAIVLAIALRRPLAADEYPRGVGDLVLSATTDERGPHAAPLRMWLQQALQLHPRTVFGSAVGAEQVFSEITGASGFRRNGALALRTLVRRACGEPVQDDPPPAASPEPKTVKTTAPPAAARIGAAIVPPVERPRGGAFLRAIFLR